MAIPALPILSFRPNWQDGLTESFVWVTDVLASDTGDEQRRSLRLSPGRFFETSFALWDAERTFFDLFLSNLGSQEMLFPLWHDIGRATGPSGIGEHRLAFDTRWREFTEGGFAVIQGKDALTYEAVEISSVDDYGLQTVAPLAQAWGTGSPIMPLRRGRFDLTDSIGFTKVTSRVGTATFRINVTEPNDWPDSEETFAIYAGYPVFTTTPDVRDNLDLSFTRNIATLGNDFGKSFYADIADRAFLAQAHAWFLKGRETQAQFRDFMFRMRGRAHAFWLPTFNDDLLLAAPAASAATTIEVHKVGYGYTGGPGPGREYIAIFMYDGTVKTRKVTGLSMPSLPTREKLQLDAALGSDISPATVRAISFMDLARFDQDQFDLQHHTDTDGLTTVSAVFKTFSNGRTAPTPIDLPVPVSVQNDFICGTPDSEHEICTPQYCTPQTIFTWALEYNGCNPSYCPTRFWYPPEFANDDDYPNIINPPILGGPSGKTIAGLDGVFNNCNNNGATYEYNYYNDPDSEWYHDPRAIKLQGQLLFEWNTTNSDFGCTYHGALVDGGGTLSIEYGPFWCGDHVAIASLTRTFISMPRCDTPTTEILIDGVGMQGNIPYTFVWT